MHSTKALLRLLHSLGSQRCIHHAAHHLEHALRGQWSQRGFQRLGIEIHCDHVGAQIQGQFDQGLAYALSGSSHNHGTTGQ